MSKSPRTDASSANTLSVSNTQLAASLAALGFLCDCKPLHDVESGKTAREFIFRGGSCRPEFSTLPLTCAKEWKQGALDLMHPLAVMMRAQHNYNRLQDMQKQAAVMNLRAVAGGRMTEYRRHTQPDPLTNFDATRLPCDDLDLAAALGGVGIPVLHYEGAEGSRRYWLPRHGYAIHREDGTTYIEDAERLMRRAPTPRDPRHLELEDRDAFHPVVLGYDALAARAVLKKLLTRAPLLHLKDGDLRGIVTANSTGRVMDLLTQRFGAPPL